MFNQIKDLAGGEFYLITSLLVFMVFFIVVSLYLFKLNKQHIATMSNLPFADQKQQQHEEV
jgi:cbb3-type cytochrome oxidase subunit 3